MYNNSDLITLDKMSIDNKKVFALPVSSNFKRANMGKNGWGEIVLAIPNETIMNLDNYIGALYLADKKEFDEYQNKE
jgi:hypothetical protein